MSTDLLVRGLSSTAPHELNHRDISLNDSPPFPTDRRPVQVSLVFNGEPNSRLADIPSDLIVRSSDAVYFAIHSQQVMLTSKNDFAGLVPANTLTTPTAPTQLTLEESCVVLNSLFRTMYGLPADEYPLDLESIRATFYALKKYGLTPLELHVFEGTYLYNAALALARTQPFETYALAGEFALEDLAVAVSARTIILSLYEIPVELLDCMGLMYLYRLYNLHSRRSQAIRDMFHIEPVDHGTKAYCSLEQRKHNRMEFRQACAQMVWDAPDISHVSIDHCMKEVVENTICPDCKAAFATVAEQILTDWDHLETTI